MPNQIQRPEFYPGGGNQPINLAAGSVISTVPTTGASGMPLIYTNAGVTISNNIKATPGTVLAFNATNGNASTLRYVQIHNTATAVASGATALDWWPIVAGATTAPGITSVTSANLAPSDYLTTGIAIAISGTPNTFDATPTAAHHLINLRYL